MRWHLRVGLCCAIVLLSGIALGLRGKSSQRQEIVVPKKAAVVVKSIEDHYRESAHAIAQVPTPTPVRAHVRFSAANVDAPITYREVQLFQIPAGFPGGPLSMAVELETTDTMTKLAADGKSAEFATKTSFRTSAADSKAANADQTVDALRASGSSRYTLDGEGKCHWSDRQESFLGSSAVGEYFEVAATVLPDRPLSVGEEWSTTAKIREDAPEAIRQQPPWLKLQFRGRYTFDGVPVLCYEGNALSYVVSGIGPLSQAVQSTSHRRLYVSEETGRIIWEECRATLQSAPLKGISITTRKERVNLRK